ncbi:MAG: AbrB/MazE/SpoVT family DNA-binding domain-containing protein [Rhodospirillaceae bacterium]|jgi:putative addiction module antidote|nr:AbrB/MazE/SpoVT family DNA-binding domain-containing protein [Rhodospirillales bacterium]MBT3906759.1 AbrB/MazE/SpoVT family DNA-binding domain-containing protein [Rhodospirillaceae bacterium]MBT4700718.1 AbrB/MazE/SpoVT family DNA-binding domain-containing protein [Rhodospirillaceae bacterium]MBT5033601.1 AbrB/MazE/SpoVT family DNA-binding domain-containing protein [Rhodospirillaceae bacterium]MBT6220083.1 AbrB/MazE/SpoVT family DNA-binding domain-containing protein [Rhodospirillaceae bacte
MLNLKVRKVGNSLSVTLPKEAASHLKVSEGDSLYLTEGPEGGYLVTPYEPGFEQKMEKAEEIMGRYRNTLRTLSK